MQIFLQMFSVSVCASNVFQRHCKVITSDNLLILVQFHISFSVDKTTSCTLNTLESDFRFPKRKLEKLPPLVNQASKLTMADEDATHSPTNEVKSGKTGVCSEYLFIS